MGSRQPGAQSFEWCTDWALALAARYDRDGDIRLLDFAVRVFDTVAAGVGPDDPEFARYQDNAGITRMTRFEGREDRADLAAALAYARAATGDEGHGHPDHPLHLSNRGHAALTGFHAAGDEDLLVEAVASGTAAVQAAASDDPDLPLYQDNLRAAQTTVFAVNGDRCRALVEDYLAGGHRDLIDRAVAAGRTAVDAAPTDEPRRWVAWSNTAHALRLRFELAGEDEDLADSVAYAKAALAAATGRDAGSVGLVGPHVPVEPRRGAGLPIRAHRDPR